MDSFYGGKPGLSIVLRTNFKSYEEMVETFKLGEEYKDCYFGEFCILDYPNKNNPRNGEVYMRGYDYQNSQGGAIYIGRIVGPSSGTPWFELHSLKYVTEDLYAEPLDRSEDVWEERSYPYDNEGTIEVWYDESNENADPPIHILNLNADGENLAMVPGKEEDGTYHDTIRYSWLNKRSSDEDNNSTYHLGIEIPYFVTEFQHTVEAPYNKQGIYDESVITIEHLDGNDAEHPFWGLWNVDIPKGVKGDTVRHLKEIALGTQHVGNKIYSVDDITVDATSGNVSFGTPSYTVEQADVNRHIIVYELDVHDIYQKPLADDIELSTYNPANGKGAVWIYLGDFNVIGNKTGEREENAIEFADDGTLTIHMTYDDDYIWPEKVRWITDASINNDNGEFKITYNNGDPQSLWLRYVKDIQIAENGDITIIYTNDGESGNSSSVTLNTKLKYITKAMAQDDGSIIFGMNTGKEADNITVKVGDTDETFHIQYIEDVYASPDTLPFEDKRIKVTYNYKDGEVDHEELVGSPLNYIQDMKVRDTDYHLLVLFNDPTHRVSRTQAESGGMTVEANEWTDPATGINWVRNVYTQQENANTADLFWRDYGTIKDDHGVLVGLNVDREDMGLAEDALVGLDDIIQYLNKTYNGGLKENAGGAPIRHKIVTFGEKDEDKLFFAFDYNRYSDGNGWYYLGRLTDSRLFDVMILDGPDVPASAHENLQYGGVALIRFDTTVSDDGLPDFWAPEYVDTYFLDDAKMYMDAMMNLAILWYPTEGEKEEGE